MSRTAAAILLFAVGLGIGLWLGFNPERRAAVQEKWERASTSIARIQTDLDIKIGGDGSGPTENESTNDSTRPEQPSPLASLSRIVRDLWEATQQLWASLVARVERSG